MDPDDSTLQISLTASQRLRKLRDASSFGGREYERRLRRPFEQLHLAPEWARK